jgi:hypothetical protein
VTLLHQEYIDTEGPVQQLSGCLVRKSSPWKAVWDWFIIIMAFYATIINTIQLSWSPFGKWYQIVDGIIFCCYIIDIFIQLRTTYTDILGNEIIEPKRIAINYLLSF